MFFTGFFASPLPYVVLFFIYLYGLALFHINAKAPGGLADTTISATVSLLYPADAGQEETIAGLQAGPAAVPDSFPYACLRLPEPDNPSHSPTQFPFLPAFDYFRFSRPPPVSF